MTERLIKHWFVLLALVVTIGCTPAMAGGSLPLSDVESLIAGNDLDQWHRIHQQYDIGSTGIGSRFGRRFHFGGACYGPYTFPAKRR